MVDMRFGIWLALFHTIDSLLLRHHLNTVLDMLPKTGNATTHFFNEAVVDHFGSSSEGSPPTNEQATQFWNQRFFVDQSFWCGEGCPIFVMIGGEGTERAPSTNLFMGYLAEKHEAMMVTLEHRCLPFWMVLIGS